MENHAIAPPRQGPFASAPAAEPGPTPSRDPRYDNQPPLEERIMLEFAEDLDREGITRRVQELLASAGRTPETCDSQSIAGKLGDLCKQARDVAQRIDAAREKHNRPLLNAQRALKGRADSIVGPLNDAVALIRTKLNNFMAAEARRVDEERRLAEEAANRARIAAAEQAGPEQPLPTIEPAKVEAPIARGDLGARVGTRTVWHHEIESVRQLPDRILKNPRVIESLDKVIAAEVRGGTRDIKGARIWSAQEAAVR